MPYRNGPAAFALFSLSVLASAFVTGCGGALPSPSATAQAAADVQLQGKVHGGQQPVSSSTVQLYAVGSSGDGSASAALLLPPAVTDANGNFSFAGFTCPPSNPLVYLTASGGNPGLPVSGTTVPNNTSIAMMAVIGPCASITTSTFVIVNELTTVAAVFPLAPFMTSLTAVGASTTDAGLLAAAFQTAQAFVNSANGQTPGPMLPYGATDPIPTLNTLADIAAACINSSGGTAGNGSSCGNLFLYAPNTSGTYPTDTVTALLNVAHNPAANTANLVAVAAGQGPFQPQVSSAPQDLTPLLLYPPTFTVSPSVLTFADTPQSTTSAAQTITLTNPNATAVYTAFKSFGGTNAGEFGITGGTCAQVLEPYGTCTELIVFTPAAGGARTALLSLTPTSSPVQRSVQLNGNGLAGTTGIVTLTPASATLPTYLGASATQLTLHNYSAAAITIYSIQLLDNVHFSQTNTCGTSLASLATCTITLQPIGLSNTQGATVSTILSVLDSSASSPQTAVLSFTETDAVSIIAPMAVNTWPVGFSVPGPSFSVQGYDAAQASVYGDYTVQTPMGCNSGYNACVIYTTFKPSAVGKRTATFGNNSFQLPLVGYGAAAGPSVATNVSSLVFPNPNTPYGNLTYEIVNNGTTATTPTVTLSSPHPEAFGASTSPSGGTPCGTMPAYTSGSTAYECSSSIGPAPGYAGTLTGTLTIAESTSGIQIVVPISGSTGYASPLVNPTLGLTFSNTHVGATSAPMTMVGAQANKDPLLFSLPSNSPFAISGPASCPYGGSPCSTTITFTPTAVGTFSTYVTVTDTVTGLTAAEYVGGTGGEATFSVSPAQYDFGTKTLGTVSNTTFTVTNTGDGTDFCPGAGTLAGIGAADYTVTTPTVQVMPGKTCTILVAFQPSAPGPRPATYTFQTSPYYELSQTGFSLSGTGTF